jgi:hypothetical protein
MLCLVQVFEMSSTAAEVNAAAPIYDPARDDAAKGPGTIKPLAQRFFDEIMQHKDRINDIWQKITNVNSDGNHYDELVENYCSLAKIFSDELKPQLSGLISASEHIGAFIKVRSGIGGILEAQKKLNECLALYYDTAKMISLIAGDLGISEEKFLETAGNGRDFKKAAAPGVLWSVADFEAKREQINKKNFIIDYRYNSALNRHFGEEYVDYRSRFSPFKLGGTKIPGISVLIDYEKQKEASVENGRLVSGLGEGESVVTYPFPVSQYLLGRFDTEETFYGGTLQSEGGWKVHVSATIASAEKVVNAVITYLNHLNIPFKVVTTAPAMRRFYARARYREKDAVSQIGKFITIYPENIGSSIKTVEDLDQILNNKEYRDGDFVIPVPENGKKFVKSDFIPCTGDFIVHSKCDGGISGALSVRYVEAYDKAGLPGLDDVQERRIPVIPSAKFLAAFPGGSNPFSAAGFTLSYHGVNLPEPTTELVNFLKDSHASTGKKSIPGESELKTEALQISLEATGFLSPDIESVRNSPAALLQKTVKPRTPPRP